MGLLAGTSPQFMMAMGGIARRSGDAVARNGRKRRGCKVRSIRGARDQKQASIVLLSSAAGAPDLPRPPVNSQPHDVPASRWPMESDSIEALRNLHIMELFEKIFFWRSKTSDAK
jgi:hypothetical protein